jgi:asparaginyl-tRNA synthetase
MSEKDLEIEMLRSELLACRQALAAKEAEIGSASAHSTLPLQAPFCESGGHGRVILKALLETSDEHVGKQLTVAGWIKRTSKGAKGEFAFLHISDGSTPQTLQVLVTPSIIELDSVKHVGVCIVVEGIMSSSVGSMQQLELHASKIHHLGACEPTTKEAPGYPIPHEKKTHPKLETLRTMPHLRSRTSGMQCVARVRSTLAFATHDFFQQRGFLYVHTPLITTSDCEGAGEMFQVTTLLGEAESPPTAQHLEAAGAASAQCVASVASAKLAAKEGHASPHDVEAAVKSMKTAREEELKLRERAARAGGLPRTDSGCIDYSKDFFGKAAFLAVSGQLEAECYACSMSSAYTFGPAFRAEESHTTRHLAEFWMIEPEMAFADLTDAMDCAESYVRFCCQALLDRCFVELEFLDQAFQTGCVERMKQVASSAFKRCSYTEAIDILHGKIMEGLKFEKSVFWGCDLASEHERYLAEQHFKSPVIVYDYPKDIKAFYMRLSDDGETVAAMDVLVPGVGELIGGSQREERLDVLEKRLVDGGMSLEDYAFYADLRRYGTAKHAGFGLGLDRLVLFATGVESIRDAIPFPRWHGHAV